MNFMCFAMGKRLKDQCLLACLIIWCCLEYDICYPNMPAIIPPTVYLENSSVKTELFIKWKEPRPKHCIMNFKTRHDFHLRVHSKDPPFKGCEPWTQPARYFDGQCNKRCPYFYFMDYDYKNYTTLIIRSTGDIGNYNSESSTLRIVACGNFSTGFDDLVVTRFLIVARKKLTSISGTSRISGMSKVLSTPFFPSPCIQNGETYTYEFTNTDVGGYITVTFDDWLLSPLSKLTFSDANIKGSMTGLHPRPYIISENDHMVLTFFTGNFRIPGTYFSYSGFRAHARFYKYEGDIPIIETDCGGVIEDKGGFIRATSVATRYKDCIWVVKKPHRYVGVHLLKAELGRNPDPSIQLSLEIRFGLTSVGHLISNIQATTTHKRTLDDHMTSEEGFYIRLRGSVSSKTLVISYAAYRYDCDHSQHEFMCDNQRCIDQNLSCDGFDHCGDQSDESSATCTTRYESSESDNSHVGIIIPLVVSLVVIAVFCIFLLLLRRCRRLSQTSQLTPPRRVQRPPRTQNVQMSVTVTSGEHPPSYSEVVRTTPISNVSLAFTWSQGDQQAVQPPSYEEAVGAENFDLSLSTRREGLGFDSDSHSYNTETPLCDTVDSSYNQAMAGFSVTNASFVASLDPGSYDSSSCSSDDNDRGDNNVRSGQSESSTDNDSLFAQAFVLVNPNSVHVDKAVSFFPERRNEDRAAGDFDHGSGRQKRTRKGGGNGLRDEGIGNRGNGVRREERNVHNDGERDVRSGYRDVDDRTQEPGHMTDDFGLSMWNGRRSSEEGCRDSDYRQQSEESRNRNSGDVCGSESYEFLQPDGASSRNRNGGRTQRQDVEETVSRYQADRGLDDALSNSYQRYEHGHRTETSGRSEDGEGISSGTPLMKDNEDFEDNLSLPLEVDGVGVKSTFV